MSDGQWPFTLSPGSLAGLFARKAVSYAKDIGVRCSMPGRKDGCDALTMGVRCDDCSRKICVGHTYWQVGTNGMKLSPFCPYCVVQQNPDIFEDDE